jgi:hypothetical protein
VGVAERRIAQLVGVSPNAVSRNLLWLGQACEQFHYENDRNLPCKRIELDELSSICYAREKKLPEHLRNSPKHGLLWTWACFDPDSKFFVAWHFDKQDPAAAEKFCWDVRARVATPAPQITTDGLPQYRPALEKAFGENLRWCSIVKERDRVIWRRDDPEQDGVKQIRKAGRVGNLDEDDISTCGVERLNLTFRQETGRYEKLSYKHSKCFEHHRAALALFATAYNYVRFHQTVRCTPAMELGVINELWEIEDLIERVQPVASASSAP